MGVFVGRGMCCTAKYFQNMACDCICWKSLGYNCGARWSSLVARWAHNPKVGGSNPSRATRIPKPAFELAFLRLECLKAHCLGLYPEMDRLWRCWMLQSASSLDWVRRAQRPELQNPSRATRISQAGFRAGLFVFIVVGAAAKRKFSRYQKRSWKNNQQKRTTRKNGLFYRAIIAVRDGAVW